jgi:hypothetical protein
MAYHLAVLKSSYLRRDSCTPVSLISGRKRNEVHIHHGCWNKWREDFLLSGNCFVRRYRSIRKHHVTMGGVVPHPARKGNGKYLQ